MRLVGEKSEQLRVDPVARPCPCARRRHEHLLMISLDDMRATPFQPRHDVVGKLIFKDTIAEAKQFIDIPHRLQG